MRGRKKPNENIEYFEKYIKQANNDRCTFCFEKIDEKVSELREVFKEEYNELKEEYEKHVEIYEITLRVNDAVIKTQKKVIDDLKEAVKLKDEQIEKINKKLEDLNKSDKKSDKRHVKKPFNKNDKKPIGALEHIHDLEFDEE